MSRTAASTALLSLVICATATAAPLVENGKLAGTTLPAEVASEHELRKSVFVPMRDGVRLSTDIYLPKGIAGPLPTILIRTPYDKSNEPRKVGALLRFVRHGFAVVVQDHRGKYESEGTFFPYPATDGRDGYDTIEWITRQSWSTGKVGTYGCSYLGETQHMMARERHKNHTAAIAQSGSSYGGDGVRNFGFHRYGATELISGGFWMFLSGTPVYYGPPAGIDRATWFSSPAAARYSVAPKMPLDEVRIGMFSHLPVEDLLDFFKAPPTEWRNWVSKPPADPYWQQQGTVVDTARFDVPTLHMNGWYDLTPTSTLELYRLFRENAESKRAADNQYLIMYPGTHCDFNYSANDVVGERPIGNATLDPLPIYIAWFNYWLRDEQNDITKKLPKVLSYALGANEWRSAPAWPLAGVQNVKFYLHSNGDARSRFGNGSLSRKAPGKASDRYAYDPASPVPALGGGICCAGPDVKDGSVDQRPIETRADLLVYTSEVLESPVTVAGRVRLKIELSADVRDTDLVGRLTDVYSDGTSYNVSEGILRLRFREGMDREVLMTPGQRVHAEVDLESTHNVFLKGHRIRLHVTSSSFPRWDRNMNTGGRNYDEITGTVANVSVHQGPESYLLLPVQQ